MQDLAVSDLTFPPSGSRVPAKIAGCRWPRDSVVTLGYIGVTASSTDLPKGL